MAQLEHSLPLLNRTSKSRLPRGASCLIQDTGIVFPGENNQSGYHPRLDSLHGSQPLFHKLMHALKGAEPTLIGGESTGGAYLLRDAFGEPRAVCKPADEEGFAVNNPRGYRLPTADEANAAVLFGDGESLNDGSDNDHAGGEKTPTRVNHGGAGYLKRGVLPGEGILREAAAFALDHGHWARVPPTTLVYIRHPSLHVSAESKAAYMAKAADLWSHRVHGSTLPGTVPVLASPVGTMDSAGASLECEHEESVNSFEGLLLPQAAHLHTQAQGLDALSAARETAAVAWPPLKHASLQLFVPHTCSAEAVSSSLWPVDEVQRIAVLDIRLANTDRHEDNILVRAWAGEAGIDGPLARLVAAEQEELAIEKERRVQGTVGRGRVGRGGEKYDAGLYRNEGEGVEEDDEEADDGLRRELAKGAKASVALALGVSHVRLPSKVRTGTGSTTGIEGSDSRSSTGPAPSRTGRVSTPRHPQGSEAGEEVDLFIPTPSLIRHAQQCLAVLVPDARVNACTGVGGVCTCGPGEVAALAPARPGTATGNGQPASACDSPSGSTIWSSPLLLPMEGAPPALETGWREGPHGAGRAACVHLVPYQDSVCVAGRGATSNQILPSTMIVPMSVAPEPVCSGPPALSLPNGNAVDAYVGRYARLRELSEGGMGLSSGLVNSGAGTPASGGSNGTPRATAMGLLVHTRSRTGTGVEGSTPKVEVDVCDAGEGNGSSSTSPNPRRVGHAWGQVHTPPALAPAMSPLLAHMPEPATASQGQGAWKSGRLLALRAGPPSSVPADGPDTCNRLEGRPHVTPMLSASASASSTWSTAPLGQGLRAKSGRASSMDDFQLPGRESLPSDGILKTEGAGDGEGGSMTGEVDPRLLRRAGRIELVPIDHGLALPSINALDDVTFAWAGWKQAREPMSSSTRQYIAALDGRDDSLRLRALFGEQMRPACLLTLRLCTALLQEGALAGLSVSEIGRMMMREAGLGRIEDVSAGGQLDGQGEWEGGASQGKRKGAPSHPQHKHAWLQLALSTLPYKQALTLSMRESRRRERREGCAERPGHAEGSVGAINAQAKDAARAASATALAQDRLLPSALEQAVRRAKTAVKKARRKQRTLIARTPLITGMGTGGGSALSPSFSAALGPGAALSVLGSMGSLVLQGSPPSSTAPSPLLAPLSGTAQGQGGLHGGDLRPLPWNAGKGKEAKARKAQRASLAAKVAGDGVNGGASCASLATSTGSGSGSMALPMSPLLAARAAAELDATSGCLPVPPAALYAFVPYHDAVEGAFRVALKPHIEKVLQNKQQTSSTTRPLEGR